MACMARIRFFVMVISKYLLNLFEKNGEILSVNMSQQCGVSLHGLLDLFFCWFGHISNLRSVNGMQ